MPKQSMPESAKLVFTGKLFDVYQWQQELYDGTSATFERLKRADTVVVVPVLDNGNLLILDEEQPAKGRYLAFPGGRREEGEEPEDTAMRELLEETGYTADGLKRVSATQPVGKIEWTVWLYAASGCRKAGEPAPDAGERITVKEVSWEWLLDAAKAGDLPDNEFTIELLRAQLDPPRMASLKNKIGIK